MSSSFEGVYEPGIVDPGTPARNSTKSFWQSEPNRFADHQSPWPSTIVDVVVIGSGVTGGSLVRTLLSERPELKVVLVDARSLCSGATARNGGHIKTMTYAVWEHRKRMFGIKEAIRLSEFEHSHLKVMTDVIRQEGIECDLKETEGLDAYYDEKTFAQALLALDDMRCHAPHLANKYRIHTNANTLNHDFHLSRRCVGAIGVPAASLWPYKMVMGLLEPLIAEDRLNVQANTTVQTIQDQEGAEYATIHTDRGYIKATNVVHATNGWLGHLLPELRPYVSPVRGNVVHYDSGPAGASSLGLSNRFSLWLRYAEKDYDYLIQRTGGDVVVGRANTARKATGNDSETDLLPQSHLRGFAGEVTACSDTVLSPITHAWSGILAFTQDSLPFVGQLPVPGRTHQWVCGGYHGIGMIKAFRTAQMAAKLVLKQNLPDEYPRSYLVNEERLRRLRRTLERNIEVVPKAQL